jgi:hypothetical protein
MATTFADQLRSLPDEALGALIQLRPDLVVPVPSDVSALAVRAQSRGSVARCLDSLDEFTLTILDAARLSRSPEDALTSIDAILEMAGGISADDVRVAVDRLRARFLLYGPDDALHVTGAVDEVTSPYPAGLGRPAHELDPAAGALVADPARLRRVLLSAPPEARAVLDRLAAGPPLGTIRDARRPVDTDPAGSADPADPTGSTDLTGSAASAADVAADVAEADGPDGLDDPAPAGPGGPTGTVRGRRGGPDGADDGVESPVRWLIRNRLLVPTGIDTVELPREVGLLLRRDDGPLGELHPVEPAVEAPGRTADAVDSAGAGQAMEAVRLTEAVLEGLVAEPAAVLRAGGLGVRDLRRLARATGVTDLVAALHLEAALAAGLLSDGAESEDGPVWLPTPAYDGWRGASLAERWSRLTAAWLAMPRQASLVGGRDDRDRPINALSGEVSRIAAPGLRRAALLVLAEQPPGSTPSPADVTAVLRWRAPRRGGRHATDAIGAALAEAAALGLTGLGGLTRYGRLLLAEQDPARRSTADADPLGVGTGPASAARALDELLPPPLDHVLVQADLTVVVPGPPEPTLAAELDLVADPESAGGATVYRVTPVSVRRALDAGLSATDLHQLFARRSRTPVPQGLTYLVDDVARRHGGLRVGQCGSYLHGEEAALLAELAADRRLAPLALRRIAPTVLVSPFAAQRVLAALRDTGYAPVPEDAGGGIVVSRPPAPRAPAATPLRQPPRELTGLLTEPQSAALVEAIRRGEAASRATRRTAPSTSVNPRSTAAALATLQQAIRTRQRIWVGYVDAHGASAARLVRPVSIGAGYLRAEDDRTETLHTFALHRITSATPADA